MSLRTKKIKAKQILKEASSEFVVHILTVFFKKMYEYLQEGIFLKAGYHKKHIL